MEAITKQEFRKIYRERLFNNNDYLRHCNEEQINNFCHMIKQDILSKYIVIK